MTRPRQAVLALLLAGCAAPNWRRPAPAPEVAEQPLEAAGRVYARLCGVRADGPGTWWRPDRQADHRIGDSTDGTPRATQGWIWLSEDRDAFARAEVDDNAFVVVRTVQVERAWPSWESLWRMPGWTLAGRWVVGPATDANPDRIGVCWLREIPRWDEVEGPLGWATLVEESLHPALSKRLTPRRISAITDGCYFERLRARPPRWGW